ncbi:MAG: toxin [Lachnospiraceae bacterium]|nr:toxin [Lachnospiraceae bacterium]
MYRPKFEYEEMVKVIIDIYLDYGFRSFPIDEKIVCRKLGVTLIPYSECPKEAWELLIKKSEYGFFVRGTREDPPKIYYNDRLKPYGTVRMTIFHEIKHYVYDEDADDEDTDDMANSFARFFLCPIPYLIVMGIESENEIVSHCGVSITVARNVASNIRHREETYGYRIFDHEIPLLRHLNENAYKIFVRSH